MIDAIVRGRRRFASIFLVLFLALAGCAANPVTGRPDLVDGT
jgi:hypothetical protein